MSTKNTDQKSTDSIKKSKSNSFIKEFGEFINRGNVVDLAIGVAVGGAFTAIVTSLVNDIIMPITSLLAGGLDFTTLSIDIPNIFGVDSTAHITYGNFIQNVVNFLLVAFVIFVIVKFINRINRKADAATARAIAEAEKAKAEKAAKKAKSTNSTKSANSKSPKTK